MAHWYYHFASRARPCHIKVMPMEIPETAAVFDRGLVRARRERAAGGLAAHDFLLREVGERLADRLADFTRTFPVALDLGCHGGEFGRVLGRRGGVRTLVQADLSVAMARRAGGHAVVADEEFLPFAAGGFDLVASLLSLHWVNDLPGVLAQISRILKPDGLMLAALFGGTTLGELRGALLAAELELEGGGSPRVAPFAELSDLGGLLQRAGLALPVVDRDTITISYPDPFALMRDLRGMGEGNAMRQRRRRPTRRAVLTRAAEIYRARHGTADGRVPATFQVLYMTGWRPHSSQQQALRPGAAGARLADALGTTERPAGDKARPK